MTDKQTRPDGRADRGTEDKAQESDLAALVRQYEQETGDGDRAALLKSLQPVVDFAKGEMSSREQAAVEEAIDQAYKFVTDDDSLKGLNKTVVRGFLEAYGVENPDFSEAFRNQKKNPGAWKSELGKGREWVKKQFEGLIKKSDMRSDLEAAKAAVAGTSTEEPEKEKVDPAKLFAMSDSAFNQHVAAEIAKASR